MYISRRIGLRLTLVVTFVIALSCNGKLSLNHTPVEEAPPAGTAPPRFRATSDFQENLGLENEESHGQTRDFSFRGTNKTHALVTGGAGYIGSHCVAELLSQGYVVTILDNLSRGSEVTIKSLKSFAPPSTLRVVIGDLGRPQDLQLAFQNSNLAVDIVFHFAAVAHVEESVNFPLQYYLNNTANTLNLLSVMEKHGVQKLVYSSTCAVYGNPTSLPITEETPLAPVNPYGKSKMFAEGIINDYAKTHPTFDAAILRYFNVIGSDPKGRIGEVPRAELRRYSRISNACFDSATGESDGFTVFGTKYPTRDGTCIRDFIHVIDLVNAHIFVAAQSKWANPPVVYNVGTGTGVSVLEFIHACRVATAKEINIRFQDTQRQGDNIEIYANVQKIQQELQWTAKYTNLSESLSHAWAFRQQFSSYDRH